MGSTFNPARPCPMSSPSLSLPRILDDLGPAQTPEGEVSWTREFPMAAERLGFSARLMRSGERLEARVVQQDAKASEDIFQASWSSRQGSWVFDGARLDGTSQSEPQAVAVFEDYVLALGAPPTVSPPRRGPGL